jgi:lipoprotein-releasing system permease protein
MAGVALTTAALVIVLSVFNGLADLLQTINNSFDPEIKIQATRGKSFEVSPELISKIKAVDGVEIVTEVIEDYAYLRYRKANQVVTIKGVGDNFIDQNRIPPENIVEGELKLRDGDINYAIVGKGIQYTLSIAVNDPMFPLEFFYIKNVKPSVTMDPSQYYSKQNIVPGGVFYIVQQFDENYVIVPLQFARDLLNYGNKRTSLEVKTKEGRSIFSVEEEIQQALGGSFTVMNHEEQHQDLYRLLKMEKLFAFLALTLLLVIGSINIFFCLMMLALDKKKDISVLSSMGASQQMVRNIFLAEGVLIAALGAFFGLVLGGFLCWLQITYGLISMGMETSVTQGYPIKVKWTDFLLTLGVVALITTLISFRPAKLASSLIGHNELLGKQL